MTLDRMMVAGYLRRIGLDALPAPTAQGLASLVRAQLRAIAFENLDVLAGRPVRLDHDALMDKLVRRGRGGHCHELNGLLAAALRSAGFEVHTALARVTYRRDEPGPLSHQVLLVVCEDATWLVDAGFGGPGLIEPIRCAVDAEIDQGGARFRLAAAADGDMHLQRRIADAWEGLYQVSFRRVLPVDIEMANHSVATWEKSPFHSIFLCARPLATGLIMLRGTNVWQFDTHLETVAREPLNCANDLWSAMRTAFGVEVEREVAERAWARVNPATAAGG